MKLCIFFLFFRESTIEFSRFTDDSSVMFEGSTWLSINCANSFSSFSFSIHLFPEFCPLRPGRRGAVRGGVERTSYHCRPLGESWAFRGQGRKILPFPRGGVHSLVKISSFFGKNRPFPSCVLRKFLLSCVHTSRELSDGNFTKSGIIWYDMPRISQCLTTPAAPDRRRGKRRRFYKKGTRQSGRETGRAGPAGKSLRRREF